MDFFEHQELARRNTRVLVLLYALAVVAVAAAVTAVLAGAYLYSRAAQAPGPVSLADVPPGLWWGAALGTLAVILLVTVVQSVRLGGDGAAVAKMAGAQPVSPETTDPLERRLLNVVEEMAIAAGVRVPRAYVMPGEPGINAFAAGSDVSSAVVAVTRGTLESLNRDELQGVIGHEFSHILHGDMRLNIRMIGVLAGIVFIGSIGRFAMHAAGRGGGGRKNGAAAVLAVGVALFIVGYTGLFFARLIKAAVARQREFLADASSVQYTRNPEGIAGALDQIRASTRGALIEGRSAEELSHMYFGESVKLWFSGIFATHPPLEERIRRVHPGFAPTPYRSRRAPPAPQPDDDEARRRKAAEGVLATAVLAAGGKRAADAEHAWGRTPQASAQLVGELDAGKLDKAQRLLASLPEALRAAVHEGAGARAAVLALVAPQASAARLDPALHLPLVDLALPALKALDETARAVFLGEVEAAIRADRRVSLHEFVLLTLLRHQLAPAAPVAGRQRIEALRDESLALLSLIAYAGHAEPAAALAAGVAQLGLRGAALLPREKLTPEAAGEALDRLRGLAPLAKALLVKAMFATASFDGKIRLGEAELLRLTGAVLDCPLPPLID